MTLASRLSTQANLGHMDTAKQKISIIVGNLILIQVMVFVFSKTRVKHLNCSVRP